MVAGPPALFVYGTLAPGQPEHGRLAPHVIQAAPARVRGRLYALAAGYPALVVDGPALDWVEGYRCVLGPRTPWADLDAYEDFDPSALGRSLYLRVVRPVSVQGRWLPAWCYVMPRDRAPLAPGAGARALRSGRWGID